MIAMTVKSVAVVSVPVSDQERAKAFYVDTLGLELVRDDSSIPGMRWIQVAPPGGSTHLTLVNWFDSMPAGSLRGLVLRMADLEHAYETLSKKGVEFEGPPAKQPWGTETVVHDPDGNALVLQQA
jgi:catechol 2,3-dioxygenase-like lactoylglutathione lyase family enzyme